MVMGEEGDEEWVEKGEEGHSVESYQQIYRVDKRDHIIDLVVG
jgi:hypothetical protein